MDPRNHTDTLNNPHLPPGALMSIEEHKDDASDIVANAIDGSLDVENPNILDFDNKRENAVEEHSAPRMKRSKRFLSTFAFKSGLELNDDDDARKFPKTCYSFLALGLAKNMIPFAYGVVVFSFQICLLLLMIFSKTVKTMSANEGVDNPDEEGFAAFMPANATVVVRTTQLVAIIAFLLFTDDSIGDFADAVRYFPFPVWSKNNWFNVPLPFWSTDNLWIALACIARGIQGALACFAVFLLVMTSTDVIDIVLNFAAVNQISSIDEHAFTLARSGRYGNALKKRVMEIENTIQSKQDFTCLNHLKDETKVSTNEAGETKEEVIDVKIKWYIPTVFIIACIVLGFAIYVARQQVTESIWEAPLFRVEFDEETGFSEYSGCYDAYGRNKDRRMVYKSKNNIQQSPAVLEYCKASRTWVFYEEPGDPCDATASVSNLEQSLHRAQSSVTNSFSVTTAFELNWLSVYNTPIDLYFIDSTIESDLFCEEFVGDGICNDHLNNYNFRFDGGDCCGTTCSKENCGKNTSISFIAFDQILENGKNGAIGYPQCTEPGKVDLTVALPEPNFQNVVSFQDAANFQDTLENHMAAWISFWSPRLELECGRNIKRTVFSIPINQSMFGRTYSNVKVGSDSACSLIARNFEPFFGSLKEYYPIADISIVRADTVNVDKFARSSIPKENNEEPEEKEPLYRSLNEEDIVGANSVEVTATLTLEVRAQNNIPKNFGSLGDRSSFVFTGEEYNFMGTVPTEIGLMTSLTELNLENNNLEGTMPTEIGNLKNLEILVFGNNEMTGSIPSQIASLLNLTTLIINNNNFEGKLSSNIGSLTKLTYLDIQNNGLTGEIPQMSSLQRLEYLNLDGNDLKGAVDCSDFTEILDVDRCQALNYFHIWYTESPTGTPYNDNSPCRAVTRAALDAAGFNDGNSTDSVCATCDPSNPGGRYNFYPCNKRDPFICEGRCGFTDWEANDQEYEDEDEVSFVYTESPTGTPYDENSPCRAVTRAALDAAGFIDGNSTDIECAKCDTSNLGGRYNFYPCNKRDPFICEGRCGFTDLRVRG
jgi:hypothetical protein